VKREWMKNLGRKIGRKTAFSSIWLKRKQRGKKMGVTGDFHLDPPK
jgi:hypothetical protein